MTNVMEVPLEKPVRSMESHTARSTVVVSFALRTRGRAWDSLLYGSMVTLLGSNHD